MDFAREQRNPAKHLTGIGFVIVLHILIVYALLNGLGFRVAKPVNRSVDVNLIEEIKPPPVEAAPPPAAPKFEKPVPDFIPPPEIQIALPAPAPTITAPPSDTPPPAAPAAPSPAPVHQVVRTEAVVDPDGCEKPEYPPTSARLGEKGSVILKFLIGADGKVLDSKIATSSGFDRLDEAARQGLSRCRFKPATADGKPEQSWKFLKYTFKPDA